MKRLLILALLLFVGASAIQAQQTNLGRPAVHQRGGRFQHHFRSARSAHQTISPGRAALRVGRSRSRIHRRARRGRYRAKLANGSRRSRDARARTGPGAEAPVYL